MAKPLGAMSDTELLALAQHVFNLIDASPGDYGQTAAFATELGNLVNTFDGSIAQQVAQQASAKSATTFKNNTRTQVEAKLADVRTVAKAAKIAPSAYDQMGLPSGGSKAPPNATVPVASVDTSVRLRHEISWTDSADLGNKKKPRGAMGAEIWVKIDGPPPGDEKDCVFLTLDAFTPYLAEYEPSDAGKMAHYMLRWRMRDGSVGGWGETESATITG